MVKLNQTIREIINKRLIDIPPKIKAEFPAIFSYLDMSYVDLLTDRYLLIVFIDTSDKVKIDKLIKKRYDPFPGLLTADKQAAIGLNNSRFVYFEGINVSDMYFIHYVKDSTAIIEDSMESINLVGIGRYVYNIKLAYIIIFGDEINHDNVGEFLDDLISYSINNWRLRNGGHP